MVDTQKAQFTNECKVHKTQLSTPKLPNEWRNDLNAALDWAAQNKSRLVGLREKIRKAYIDAHTAWHGRAPDSSPTLSLTLVRMWSVAPAILFVQEIFLGAYTGGYAWNLGPLAAACMGIFIAIAIFAVAWPFVKLLTGVADAVRDQDRRLRRIALWSAILWAICVALILLLARAASTEIPGVETLFNASLIALAFISPTLASALTNLIALRSWGNGPAKQWAEIDEEEAGISSVLLDCATVQRKLQPGSNSLTAALPCNPPSQAEPSQDATRLPSRIAAITGPLENCMLPPADSAPLQKMRRIQNGN